MAVVENIFILIVVLAGFLTALSFGVFLASTLLRFIRSKRR